MKILLGSEFLFGIVCVVEKGLSGSENLVLIWRKHCIVLSQMAELLDNLYSQGNYLVSKKLLDATHLRHETLANNLANVETPGFKRRDLPKTVKIIE